MSSSVHVMKAKKKYGRVHYTNYNYFQSYKLRIYFQINEKKIVNRLSSIECKIGKPINEIFACRF